MVKACAQGSLYLSISLAGRAITTLPLMYHLEYGIIMVLDGIYTLFFFVFLFL